MGRVTFRSRYLLAIRWLLANTDVAWLDDEGEVPLTIEASLIAYIFDVNSSQVLADMRVARERRFS
jgi:hypothetical protein